MIRGTITYIDIIMLVLALIGVLALSWWLWTFSTGLVAAHSQAVADCIKYNLAHNGTYCVV